MVKLEMCDLWGLLDSSSEGVKQRRDASKHALWKHCSASLEEHELERRKTGEVEMHTRLQQLSGKKYRGGLGRMVSTGSETLLF